MFLLEYKFSIANPIIVDFHLINVQIQRVDASNRNKETLKRRIVLR